MARSAAALKEDLDKLTDVEVYARNDASADTVQSKHHNGKLEFKGCESRKELNGIYKRSDVHSDCWTKDTDTVYCFYWKIKKRTGWWLGHKFQSKKQLLGFCKAASGAPPPLSGWRIMVSEHVSSPAHRGTALQVNGEELADPAAGFQTVEPTRDEIIQQICTSHTDALMACVDTRMSQRKQPDFDDRKETSSFQLDILRDADVIIQQSYLFCWKLTIGFLSGYLCSNDYSWWRAAATTRILSGHLD